LAIRSREISRRISALFVSHKLVLFNMNVSRFKLEDLIVAFFLASAVLGYVVSYEKLYLFHLASAFYLFSLFTSVVKLSRRKLASMQLLFLFYIYSAVSLVWSPDILNGLFFLFYFANGILIVFVIVNYAKTPEKLYFCFKTLSIFLILNFLVGFLETTGYFRLPVSPYFGKNHTWPSGFNSNLNNFGFVFIIIFPFFFLHRNKLVKLSALFLAIWFSYFLESKGYILSLSLLFCFFALTSLDGRSFFGIFLISIICVLGFMIFNFSFLEEVFSSVRQFPALAQVGVGLELMAEGNIDTNDSTGTRAYFYLYGLREFFASYGLGLGIAGIGTILAENANTAAGGFSIISFHNFFLEMLIDFGFIPFFVMMYAYLWLIYKLYSDGRRSSNYMLGYFSKACGLSLLVALPASISPSSIIYVFTFWIVIGFSMAVYHLLKLDTGK